MILSKKIRINLNERDLLIISVLLGLSQEMLKLKGESQKIKKQEVFQGEHLLKIGFDTLRLSLDKSIKETLQTYYEIYDNFFFISNPVIAQLDNIVKLKLLELEESYIDVLLLYKREAKALKEDKHTLYLGSGGEEPLAALDPIENSYFLLGGNYLEQEEAFRKEISRLVEINKKQSGKENPEPTKRIIRLKEKKENTLKDILHKLTRKITDYCLEHDVTSVFLFRQKKIQNFPMGKFIRQLRYKLKLEGIRLREVKEFDLLKEREGSESEKERTNQKVDSPFKMITV